MCFIIPIALFAGACNRPDPREEMEASYHRLRSQLTENYNNAKTFHDREIARDSIETLDRVHRNAGGDVVGQH